MATTWSNKFGGATTRRSRETRHKAALPREDKPNNVMIEAVGLEMLVRYMYCIHVPVRMILQFYHSHSYQEKERDSNQCEYCQEKVSFGLCTILHTQTARNSTVARYPQASHHETSRRKRKEPTNQPNRNRGKLQRRSQNALVVLSIIQ